MSKNASSQTDAQATLHIGAHVSASGGPDKAIERAAAIGANCVQIFSGSPRVWQKPKLESIDADKVFAKQQELSISPLFTHALYLINLASEKPELLRKSTEAIVFDLKFDAKLKGAGVVVHVGSHLGNGWEAVREQVVAAIREILAQTPTESHFLIENAAAHNGKIGGRLEEIRWMIDQVGSERLGWCLDTCHAFAAGYEIGKGTGAKRGILDEVERLKLEDRLWCVHVNDSRDPFESGRDRHANIGDGLIPPADLAYFVNHPLIKSKPMILEVPGTNKSGPDAENIARLRKIANA